MIKTIRSEGQELSLNLASIVYDATETNLNFSSTNLAQDVSQTNIKKRNKYYENILLGNCNVKCLWQRRVPSPGAIWIPFALGFNVTVDITYFFILIFLAQKFLPRSQKKLTLSFNLLKHNTFIFKIGPRQGNKPCTLCSPELHNYLFLLSSR